MLSTLTSLAAAALVAFAPISAQSPAPAGDKPLSLTDYPPSVRLGIRAASVQAKIPVSDSVVIVSDEAAYVAAISHWKPTLHFPVLIDDGSWPAQEAIARFVRAYRPKQVVRWSSDAPELPTNSAQRRAAIEHALASAWLTPEGTTFEQQLKAIELTPAGVVVMNDRDPAWTAGLALAAGRGQPIVWGATPGNPANWCPPDQADALAQQITAGCESLGYQWKDLGDEIDAVTLCMNASVKVFLGKDDKRSMISLTDVIGRFKDPGDEVQYTKRWAWCGQVLGDAPRAATDAMSALFLTPSTAWLFDGYPDSEPWNTYDLTKAADPLKKLGFGCVIDDSGPSGGGAQGIDDWRWRAAGGRVAAIARSEAPPREMGIEAGLIAINSKGEGGYFELTPGVGLAGDMPILRRPAMVYFVHSWSATAPSKRETVAARFIEHGAYAYCGSVHEPYLQGFVPTPIVTARLAGGLPWGAAVRFDNGPAWKIALLGDPLITLRPTRTRAAGELPLEKTVELREQVGELGKAGDYAGMLRALSMLARDEDATRLARALLKDKPEAVTEDVALAGVMSTFIQGDISTLVELLSRCKARQAEVPMLADIAWQALYPVGKALTADERSLLVASIRPDSAARDARELADQVKQGDGRIARDNLIARARGIAVYEADKKALDAMLRE